MLVRNWPYNRDNNHHLKKVLCTPPWAIFCKNTPLLDQDFRVLGNPSIERPEIKILPLPPGQSLACASMVKMYDFLFYTRQRENLTRLHLHNTTSFLPFLDFFVDGPASFAVELLNQGGRFTKVDGFFGFVGSALASFLTFFQLEVVFVWLLLEEKLLTAGVCETVEVKLTDAFDDTFVPAKLVGTKLLTPPVRKFKGGGGVVKCAAKEPALTGIGTGIKIGGGVSTFGMVGQTGWLGTGGRGRVRSTRSTTGCADVSRGSPQSFLFSDILSTILS